MSTATAAPSGTAAPRRSPRRSPEQRRAQIAAAARELALDEGLAAVTLRAVAARAGVTPALVAHYMPSMDDLVAATFAAVVGAELDELRGLQASVAPVPRLAAVLRSVLDGTRDDVTLVWIEAYALGRRSEPLAQAVRAAMDRWQRMLRDLLADGVAAGAFRIADPADAAWQLLGMIDGLNAQALVRWGGASDRSALLLHAVEGMLDLSRGILTAPAPAPAPARPQKGTP
ncbi:MAG TPA: TetR family transcriptional regulator C-terminal domain-containing protein [Microbacterium sp.]|nr:TetR family transcriptional regulator C-terminal domain-containing protein [Microbacterium sp.]